MYWRMRHEPWARILTLIEIPQAADIFQTNFTRHGANGGPQVQHSQTWWYCASCTLVSPLWNIHIGPTTRTAFTRKEKYSTDCDCYQSLQRYYNWCPLIPIQIHLQHSVSMLWASCEMPFHSVCCITDLGTWCAVPAIIKYTNTTATIW